MSTNSPCGALFSAWLAIWFLAAGSAALAQEETESRYDKIWSHGRLYAGGEDSFFQSVDLSGRLQLDLACVENAEDSHSEFNVRQFRFGFNTVCRHFLVR